MENILDYIRWRGDLTFSQSAFNEIDALILCQIIYLNFDDILVKDTFDSGITLRELNAKFKSSPDYAERSDLGVLINPLTVKLLDTAACSERFSNICVTGYKSILDQEREEQFASVTYVIDSETVLVAFRGTDDNVVGWKEDFNLAVCEEVPAQKDAVEYLEAVLKAFKCSVYIGGHSKGGNLAVYSGAKISTRDKKYLKRVYNFDGPGFTKDKLETEGFKEILPVVKSIYPYESIVGRLFDSPGKYKVIDAEFRGIIQHDPFKWGVSGASFVCKKKFSELSNFFYNSINTWIDELSEEQITQFVETLFSLLQSTDAKTNSDLEKNFFMNAVKIVQAASNLDPEVRKALDSSLRSLVSIASKKFVEIEKVYEGVRYIKNNVRENIEPKLKAVKAEIRNKVEK